MNVFLWVVQVVLALFNVAGGSFKIFQYDELAKVPAAAALPRAGWAALGVLEILCAILLIVPAAFKWMPQLTPFAAAVLTVEGLALAASDARYSLALDATNPMWWALGLGLLAAVVAYGRWSLVSS